MRVHLQPAYILHTRPYRDSSVIVDVLSQDYGRLSVLAKGQRQSSTKNRKPLQPFAELNLSWQGERELKFLVDSEFRRVTPSLTGVRLYSGMYVNELLMRLLVQGDECPEIFQLYQKLLNELGREMPVESCLRSFEIQLLDQLGYGVDFFNESDSGRMIEAEKFYSFEIETGFNIVELRGSQSPKSNYFLGEDLLAIAHHDFSSDQVRKSAKRFMRLALAPHIGSKPLQSRALFQKPS